MPAARAAARMQTAAAPGLQIENNRADALAQRELQQVADGGHEVVRQLAWVVQRGDDPIDESKGIGFRFGLIKGTFVPQDNSADMHVENKTKETGFSLKDVYKAFDFVYRSMVRQKQKTETDGRLTWNPQGAAVIKMVAELIGETLGDPELLQVARTLKQQRKAHQAEDVIREDDTISKDIVPEHVQYLVAATGAEGITMKSVIPGKDTMENYDSDLLEDSEEGRARMANYLSALNEQLPVSLRISINQTQLGLLLAKMKSMKGG